MREEFQELFDGKDWPFELGDAVAVHYETVYDMPDQRLHPDTITYSAAISGRERAGQWLMALRLLRDMPDQRLLPGRPRDTGEASSCAKKSRPVCSGKRRPHAFAADALRTSVLLVLRLATPSQERASS